VKKKTIGPRDRGYVSPEARRALAKFQAQAAAAEARIQVMIRQAQDFDTETRQASAERLIVHLTEARRELDRFAGFNAADRKVRAEELLKTWGESRALVGDGGDLRHGSRLPPRENPAPRARASRAKRKAKRKAPKKAGGKKARPALAPRSNGPRPPNYKTKKGARRWVVTLGPRWSEEWADPHFRSTFSTARINDARSAAKVPAELMIQAHDGRKLESWSGLRPMPPPLPAPPHPLKVRNTTSKAARYEINTPGHRHTVVTVAPGQLALDADARHQGHADAAAWSRAINGRDPFAGFYVARLAP